MSTIIKTKNATLINGDCITEIKNIENVSIDFSIFSPPFAELYVYSDNLEDMGNSKDYNEFFEHYSYLVPELYRIMKNGRNIAIHTMDIPIQKGKDGYIGLRDFSGMIIKSMEEKGFIYHSRITIWKNPAVEMQRTKALGLLHKQLSKDSTKSRVGLPDYLLIFKKPGDNAVGVKTKMSIDDWQKLASPVWFDINQTNTLNSVKGDKDEKHICPLQLDVIKNAITLYSNETETIFSPFAGIGSEGYESILNKRKFIGIELKKEYFEQMTKNINNVEELAKQLEIF